MKTDNFTCQMQKVIQSGPNSISLKDFLTEFQQKIRTLRKKKSKIRRNKANQFENMLLHFCFIFPFLRQILLIFSNFSVKTFKIDFGHCESLFGSQKTFINWQIQRAKVHQIERTNSVPEGLQYWFFLLLTRPL